LLRLTAARRFAIRRQTATFSKAEFAAAHSRKGGICCGSQPQRHIAAPPVTKVTPLSNL